MRDQHPMDDFFARKLRGHSIPVTDDMWKNIASGVEKKRRRYLWIWLLAGAVILTAGLGGYIWFSSDTATKENIRVTAKQPELTQKVIMPRANDKMNTDVNIGSVNRTVDEEKRSLDNKNKIADKEYFTHNGSININKSAKGLNVDQVIYENGDLQEWFRGEKNNISGQFIKNDTINKNDALVDQSQTVYVGGSTSDVTPAEEKSYNTDAAEYSYIESPASISGAQFSIMNFQSMRMPRVRNIRDRNCEDEAFSAGRTFLEFSYGLQQGNMIFRSTGPQFDDYRDFRGEGETWRNGTHLQALIGFQMGNGLFFKTGISYNRMTSDYRFVDQVNKRNITDSIWNPVKNDWDVFERQTDIVISGTNVYTFVDIPLLLSYGFQFNKLGVALTAGPMVNLSFGREGQLPDFEGKGIDLSDGVWNDRDIYRKTAGINLFTSVQISYQTYRNVELFIEPRLILPMNSLTLENDGTEPDIAKISYPISQRMFQYGLGIGFRYSITK